MTPEIFEKTETCLFCNKARHWRSIVAVMDDETGLIMFIVTICPDCRRSHTVKETYEKVIELVAADLKKVIESEGI